MGIFFSLESEWGGMMQGHKMTKERRGRRK
jgi:hypothetical protein